MILKLYNDIDCFFMNNKKELLEICDVLEGKDLFIESDLLVNYFTYKEEKEKLE